MAAILSKKYTEEDNDLDILKAVKKLAADKKCRIMLKDDNEWKEKKLKERARLVRIVIKRF